MARLGVIENGVIVNVLAIDDEAPSESIPDGCVPLSNDNVQIGYLYDRNAFTAPDPAPHEVRKLLAIDRLIDAGLDDDLFDYLEQPANKIALRRFNAAVTFASNDPNVRFVLTEIGADPDVILRPGDEA